MTPAERDALRERREWTVSDFAAWLGVSQWRARQRLLAIDRASGGRLLRPSTGKNRRYSFIVADLREARPDLFAETRDLGELVDELMERVEELEGHLLRVAKQVGANTRALAARGPNAQDSSRSGARR